MPDPRLGKLLGALLPRHTAEDAFEPAWADIRIAYLRRAGGVGALGRFALFLGYALAGVVLYLDCWRLALGGLFGRPERSSHTHPIITEPKQTERFSMFLYLLRHAFRQLVREPAFTVAALLTLALGVGANVAVFAVVEAVLLRPLPYAKAGDLVILNHRDKRTGITKEFIAVGDYVDLVARQSAFESIAAYGRGQTTVVDKTDPFRVSVLGAAPGLLEVLRAKPVLGRTFTADDSRQGAPPRVVATRWKALFGMPELMWTPPLSSVVST